MKDEQKHSGVNLEVLKSLIIDQEILLTTYTDQWELLYSDLASCVKIMLSMERKTEGSETQELRSKLDTTNSQLTKASQSDAQRQATIKTL